MEPRLSPATGPAASARDRAADHDPTVPRGWLLAVGALLALTIVGAGWGRLAREHSPETPAPVRQSRLVVIADRADGGIDVRDARDGRTVDELHGEQGFVRGVLRGLARERKRRGLGPEAPLQLVARVDGRFSLEDPSTGQHIPLDAFGAENSARFVRWLPGDDARPLTGGTR